MKATILKTIKETPRVYSIWVRLETPISFKTGQCMRWNWPGVTVGKLFSMANHGGENVTDLMFTIRIFADGVISSHIPDLKTGDTVDVQGPYGKFTFDDTDTHDIVLIAGGTGVSVLRAILMHVLEKKLPNKVHLLFSVLNHNEVIYKDELEQLAQQYPNFKYDLVLTQSEGDWYGYSGYINEGMFDELFAGYKQTFFVCGPPPFIKLSEDILKSKGVGEDRIKIDRWVF